MSIYMLREIAFLLGYFVMKLNNPINWVLETDYKFMIDWGNPVP